MPVRAEVGLGGLGGGGRAENWRSPPPGPTDRAGAADGDPARQPLAARRTAQRPRPAAGGCGSGFRRSFLLLLPEPTGDSEWRRPRGHAPRPRRGGGGDEPDSWPAPGSSARPAQALGAHHSPPAPLRAGDWKTRCSSRRALRPRRPPLGLSHPGAAGVQSPLGPRPRPLQRGPAYLKTVPRRS